MPAAAAIAASMTPTTPTPGDAARPRILCLMHLLPWPLDGGGQLKSYYVLKALASRYDVRLIAFVRRDGEEANAEPLEPLCRLGIELVRLPRNKVTNLAGAIFSCFNGTSFIMQRDNVPAMRDRVRQEIESGSWAALHVDHLQMMQFVPADTRHTKVVLDNHNVEWRIPKRIAETAGGPTGWYARQEWPKLKQVEANAVRRADLTLAVSDEDARELREMAGPNKAEQIVSVPIGVDLEYFGVARPDLIQGGEAQPPSHTLVSIGTMYWPPNVDAMQYFVRDIWPHVRQGVGDARLMIVGARPTPAVVQLGEQDGVTVTGSVPDVRPYAQDCGAFVVPLRSGSGMRVKILNALAMGLPVVSTTVGAEGIGVTDGENTLLADEPEDFARACVRLMTEPGLGARLGRAGRALMEAQYGWDSVGRQLLAVYENKVMQTVQTEKEAG